MLTYVPAAQVVQLVQLDALLVVVNVPAAHAAQVRSVVLEPLASTRVPATQLVHAAHGVAEVPSWSHVSPVHA